MNTDNASGIRWTKSSYCGGNEGECVEVGARWAKSSHCGGNGGECVEIAHGIPGLIPIRDSKTPHHPILAFPATSWSGFLSALHRGEFDQ
ncbi:DUF397 domain-containing protein [Streptomyces gamaensis]|uniref:DUF397 domain-containing protein n=1 Tax=Streptomyces gamaensis TaxID=1763542 RepID=A0ABW0YTY7_9ACTN